ncbi:MAG: M24 family metallopeptidase [Dehalococcoidia bacterium]
MAIELLDFEAARGTLDDWEKFNRLRNTPYYQDAVYPKFSDAEYQRRYRLTREKMARLGLDCLVVGGGPTHWSFGAGMLWLSGHWDWHAMACFVVFPLEGEPTLVYSAGGAHIEATRRAVAVKDVRSSRMGRFAEVAVERIKELGLESGTIGLTAVDPVYGDYMPVNQFNTLREGLPQARFEFLGDFFHEFLVVKSPEELDCVRKAGDLCARAILAMRDAARPGVAEYELAAAAAGAMIGGGGQVDFLIIGSTPMGDPHMVFGNPRPSARRLQKGDIIINEIAAAYQGYSAQIGVPICVGQPNDRVRRMFDEVVLPGFLAHAQELRPGNTLTALSETARIYRDHGYQSRPLILHGLDLVSHRPHVLVNGVRADEADLVMKPGMTLMLEPNAISADGLLGMFFGHTFIITEEGNERVDTRVPLELLVAEA